MPAHSPLAATEHRPALVALPTGSFAMGSESGLALRFERPKHSVAIEHRIAMAVTPVTGAQYSALLGNAASPWEAERPAVSLSWSDAARWCNRLSAAEGLPSCYRVESADGDSAPVNPEGLDCLGYRLPTEAEWEFAARGGSKNERYGDLNAIAWWDRNSMGNRQPVAQLAPNAWGLHDMLGNVWEWVEDCAHPDYQGAPTDGSAWNDEEGCAERVLRGGAWDDGEQRVRAASRHRLRLQERSDLVGFRVVRTLP